MYVCVSSAYKYMHHFACLVPMEARRGAGSCRTAVTVVVSCHVCAGNRTLDPFKSSRSSCPLSHFSSPFGLCLLALLVLCLSLQCWVPCALPLSYLLGLRILSYISLFVCLFLWDRGWPGTWWVWPSRPDSWVLGLQVQHLAWPFFNNFLVSEGSKSLFKGFIHDKVVIIVPTHSTAS